MEGVTNIVPGIFYFVACCKRIVDSVKSLKSQNISFCYTALGGVNLKELLDDAAYEPGGKLLLDFNDTIGDRIQVFLE